MPTISDFKTQLFDLVAARKISSQEALSLLSARRAHVPEHGAQNPRTEPAAVIGMAGRFPGACDLDAFARMLAEGRNAVTEIPASRWERHNFFNADPSASYCKWGGFLEDVDQFDPLFFNISGQEAELTDPQQRLFLEESWHALEDAGYAPESLAGKRCGVFVGTAAGDYLDLLERNGQSANGLAFLGNSPSILAGRLSYLLDLQGPAVSIDTACSSSLVAVHLACESLRAGTSEVALAGGVCV